MIAPEAGLKLQPQAVPSSSLPKLRLKSDKPNGAYK